MNKITKNYETLLQKITESKDVSKYWFDGIELELAKYFEVLTKEEITILNILYGFKDNQLKSYEEVGEMLGMISSEIKNIEHLILKKLRCIFNLNNHEFIFNPDNILYTTKALLKEQQAHDDYYATTMPPTESSSTKFYKHVIKVAESHKKDDNTKKKTLEK